VEKISKIIAPSVRTRGYDSSRAQPARPGAPQAGRPQFEPITDRVSLSETLTDSMQDQFINPSQVEKNYSRPVSQTKSELIKSMSEKFFQKNQSPKEILGEEGQTFSEKLANGSNDSVESSVMPESSSELSL
jgi:hypothetical protein